MWPLVLVWLAAIVIGALLWQRFTKPPTAPSVLVPGQRITPRRVVPLWLVLVLLLLLVAAIWITFQWGGTPQDAVSPAG